MRTVQDEKITYSVPDLGRVLGIGRNAAYELTQRADFPVVRIGERRIVIPVEGLHVWLEEQAGNANDTARR